MKIKQLVATLLCFFLTGQVFAQNTRTTYGLPKAKEFDRFSVGGTIGVSHLLGDLLKGDQNNNRFLNSAALNLSYGIQGHYQVTHSIGIRGRVLLSKFTGTDQDYLDSTNNYQPVLFTGSGGNRLYNEKFESPLLESSLEMTYNFGNISFLNRNKNFHFVATLGVGMFNFDAKVKEDTVGSPLLRKSGNITEMMIPMSLGFKYKINKVDIGLALEYRKTFTDDIDATIKTYSEFDNYIMLNAAVNYTFGKKNKPMEWVNPMEVVYNDLADMKEKIDILSGDKDKDGVSDLFDKDNSTAEGSKVYGDGTAVDTDGDGIADAKDADPFTAKGAKVDANGQEADTDADGVADSKDLEPNTIQGSLVNFQGITLAKPGEFGTGGLISGGPAGSDSSASGINGANGANGRNGTGFLPSVFFDLGSATVKEMYNDRLLVIARLMKANPKVKLKITGNCDVRGNETGNMKLGQRRADNVKNHLVKQYGIDASRLTTETKGKQEPMASSLNAMNRRVDFSVE